MENIDKEPSDEVPPKTGHTQQSLFKLPNASPHTTVKTNHGEIFFSNSVPDKGRLISSPNDQCSDKITNIKNVSSISNSKISAKHTESSKDSEQIETLEGTRNSDATDKKYGSAPQTPKTGINPQVPYKEPPWGRLAPPLPANGISLYTIDELKNGVVRS